ncbi:MAG TPA: hypothetical protein VMB48_02965 [Steroidobacteraceae bacterium]|nr:hypothetical protein [Steroidobacteraceae bacterium]
MSSRSCNSAAAAGVLLLAALLGACSSAPRRPPGRPAATGAAGAPAAAGTAGTAAVSGATGTGGAGAAAPPPVQAVADFDRAVAAMRAGNTVEAELDFQQVSLQWPQYASPEINLGLLYRKDGDLAKSEAALREAVKRNPSSAVAWDELGVTLRLAGRFHDAVDAYQHAIAADAQFAPPYRNLAIVLDLYLGDVVPAYAAMLHYQSLAGDDKVVAGWVADLKRRAAKAGAAVDAPGAPGAAVPATGPATAPGSSPSGPTAGQAPAASSPAAAPAARGNTSPPAAGG